MLKLSCPKHPKYQAVLSPRASCEPCKTLWDIKQIAEMNHVKVKEKKATEAARKLAKYV